MKPDTSLNFYNTNNISINASRFTDESAQMRVTLNPNHHINALSHRRLEGFFDDLNRLERKIERLDSVRHNLICSSDELFEFEDAVGQYVSAIKSIENHQQCARTVYQRPYFHAKHIAEKYLAKLTMLHQQFNWARRTCETEKHYIGAPNDGTSEIIKPVKLRSHETVAPFHKFNKTLERFGPASTLSTRASSALYGNHDQPLKVTNRYATHFSEAVNTTTSGEFQRSKNALTGNHSLRPLQPGHHLFYGFR